MSPRRRGRGHGGRGPSGPVSDAPDGVGPGQAAADSAGDLAAERPANGPRPPRQQGTGSAPIRAERPEPNGGRSGGDRSGGDRGPRRDGAGPRPAGLRPPVAPRAIAAAPIAASPALEASEAETASEGGVESAAAKSSCTLAQMRRFIKSRPYIPVHELRRRFLIEGIEDEVSPMTTGQGVLYVGLPQREAGFLGELVKAGEVGCEMLLDPTSPGVVGVFPMRPVARQ